MNIVMWKDRFARALDFLGIHSILFQHQKSSHFPFIRVFNYHDVPSCEKDRFEKQLQYFSKHYENVTLSNLADLIKGKWTKKKPGIILSFDDGLRSHHDVAAPLLEQYRFTGYFFIPIGLLESTPEKQKDLVEKHQVYPPKDQKADQRMFMTIDEMKTLDRRHVIGCHTLSHCRLSAGLGKERLEQEIYTSKQKLESILGHPVTTFAWVGGEEESYSAEAAETIREAGFQFSFMTNTAMVRPHSDPLQIQRTNIESSYSLPLVRFQQSGIWDRVYAAKRNRVNRLTSGKKS